MHPHSWRSRRTSRILRMVCRVDISSCVPEERGASFATTTVVARPRGQGGLAGAQRGHCPRRRLAPRCTGISAQVRRNQCPSVRNVCPSATGMAAQVRPESVPKCGRNTQLLVAWRSLHSRAVRSISPRPTRTRRTRQRPPASDHWDPEHGTLQGIAHCSSILVRYSARFRSERS